MLKLELGLMLELELNKGPRLGLCKVVSQASMVCWADLANTVQTGCSVLAMQGTQTTHLARHCLSVGHN